MGMTFNILNEKYLFKNAVILSVVTCDVSEDKFLLYAVNDYEDNDYNFMISYLRIDDDGYNYLENINDDDVIDYFRNKLGFLIDGGKYNE